MNAGPEPLYLIVVDDAPSGANAVTDVLREAGHAVKMRREKPGAGLRTALLEWPCDLILTRPRPNGFSAVDVLSAVIQAGADAPVLILTTGADDDQGSIDLLFSGARDIVRLDRPEHLRHAVMREVRSCEDRRELRRCNERLRQAEGRALGLADNCRDGVALVAGGVYRYANDAFRTLFGIDRSLENETARVEELAAPADQVVLSEWLGRGVESHRQAIEFTVPGGTGRVSAEAIPATCGGEPCIQLTVKPLMEEAADSARRDLLTGLFNRNHFVTRLTQALTGPKPGGYLLHVRPDNLRKIRREIGVPAADVALAELAVELNRRLGAEAGLARTGNESFAALLTGTDAATADRKAEALVNAARELRIDIAGRQVVLTCSVGLAPLEGAGATAHKALEVAAAATHEAMHLGGDTFRRLDPSAAARAERESAGLWERQLRHALESDGFRLFYQPIVSLRGDITENYEALLRLVDDNGEYITPSAFLPAALHKGLMTDIDRWVVARAARLLHQRGNINLFVKLSEQSLMDERFPDWLDQLVATTALPAMALTLEINGSIAQQNPVYLERILEAGHRNGMRLALDHFRPMDGWEGLLNAHTVDFLKFDGSLINDIAANPTHQQTVRKVVHAAKPVGTATIAQFVENANTLAALWTCGIDYIQGYFLQEPGTGLDYDFTLEG